MWKEIGVLCAATIVSAGLLAVPADARDQHERWCGNDSAVGTGISAVAGGITERHPQIAYYRDFRINRAYSDIGYWDRNRWHSSNDRHRDNRRDHGQYGDDRYSVDRYGGKNLYRNNRTSCAAYQRTMCREYIEMHSRPGRYSQTHVACLADDGTWRVVN